MKLTDRQPIVQVKQLVQEFALDDIYYDGGQTSSVEDRHYITAPRPELGANVPNPFNAATDISFRLPEGGAYRIEIYDLAGRLVKTFDGIGAEGYNAVHWDGRDDQGRNAASGTFFYRLVSGSHSETKKMMLVK